MPTFDQIKAQLELDPFAQLMLRAELRALPSIIKSDEYIYADLHGYWQNDHVLALATNYRILIVDNNSINEIVLVEFPYTPELTFRCPTADSIVIGTEKQKIKIVNAIEEKVADFYKTIEALSKGEVFKNKIDYSVEMLDKQEVSNPFSFIMKSVEGFTQLISPNKMATNKSENFSTEEVKVQPKQPIEALMAELNQLVGLENIKEEVKRLTSVLQVEKKRIEQGIKVPERSLHSVFTGNPGTGKTTIARLLAKIFHSLDVLSKGHLMETDRSGLVAGYTGQTALKTREICEKAKGGILFIDEAYSLNSMDSYGAEAMSTILKFMEDNRDDFVVILAGYQEPMKLLIDSNPGLKSRFNKYIEFKDYTADELLQIFLIQTQKVGLEVEDAAKEKIKTYFEEQIKTKDETFGNGRLARNYFEKVYENQAIRLVKEGLETANLNLIKAEDVQ